MSHDADVALLVALMDGQGDPARRREAEIEVRARLRQLREMEETATEIDIALQHLEQAQELLDNRARETNVGTRVRLSLARAAEVLGRARGRVAREATGGGTGSGHPQG